MLLLQEDLAPGDAGHVEQVVDDVHHMVDLAIDDRDRPASLVPVQSQALEHGDAASYRRQRVAQLVREHGHELVLVAALGAQRALSLRELARGQVVDRDERPGLGPRRRRAGEAHLELAAFVAGHHQVHALALVRLATAREHSLQEVGEGCPVHLVDEQREPTLREAGARDAQHASGLEVDCGDHAFGTEHHVADRGKVEKLGVPLQARFGLLPRRAKLLVLDLQLELVHFQLLDDARLEGLLRHTRLALRDPQLGASAQLGAGPARWLLHASLPLATG